MTDTSEHLHVGDYVVEGSDEGRVVAAIDLGEYDAGFPREEWSYLATGVLVRFRQAGLVHYPRVPPELLRKQP